MAEQAKTKSDFVQHGSEQHAQLLGLRKAVKEDTLQYHSWTLQDFTIFGPNAREEFIKAQLISKVNELENPPTVPTGAPPMWTPTQKPL